MMLMPRGGRREGAGSKPSWKHGKTKPVRVPVAIADRILEIARIIDEEGDPGDTARTIDLTGVAIHQSRNGAVVRLADLLRVGYRIKPERLIRHIEPQAKNDPSSELEELLERVLEDYEQ